MKNEWRKIEFTEKTGCDQNWMVRNLICTSFSESRALRQRVFRIFCSTSNNAFAVFNCRSMRIRSTRFGTPLNLLATGRHQAFSTPCVICQLFSCRRKNTFLLCFVLFCLSFHCVKCAEMKGFCVVFNSRSY